MDLSLSLLIVFCATGAYLTNCAPINSIELEEGKVLDEKIDEALDFYKYSILLDSLKALSTRFQADGVKVNPSGYQSSASSPEFVNSLLEQVLKNKNNNQARLWASREKPEVGYVGGKREFELFFDSTTLRDCRTINEIMVPILGQLSEKPELLKVVSEETLSYWHVMRSCELIIKGRDEGELTTSLYRALQEKFQAKKGSSPEPKRTGPPRKGLAPKKPEPLDAGKKSWFGLW